MIFWHIWAQYTKKDLNLVHFRQPEEQLIILFEFVEVQTFLHIS